MSEPGARVPGWRDVVALGCLFGILGLAALGLWSVQPAASDVSLNELDLEAQQTMAFWTIWVAGASVAGVMIGGFGLFYLARTYEQAKLATAAANRRADEARKVGEAQVRAYLSYSHANAQLTGDCSQIDLAFRVDNSGASPANDVLIADGAATLFLGNETADSFDFGPVVARPKNFGDVSSGGLLLCEFSIWTTAANAANIGRQLQRDVHAKLIVTGVVTFTDVFNNVHRERVTMNGGMDSSFMPTSIEIARLSWQ